MVSQIKFNKLIIVFLLLTISTTVFFINYFVQGPMIQGDEASYLANASAIAGFPNDMSSSYHAGYSLILSPAFLLADTYEHIWSLVKIINALLVGISFLFLYFIVELLMPAMKWFHKTGIALLVILYPMWITMSGYAFSENAFVPTYLLVTLLYLKALKDGSVIYWILLGTVIGFLYWIHPKAVAAILAFFLSLVYWSYQKRQFLKPSIALLVLVITILLYKFGFSLWLQENMTISGESPRLHYPTLERLLSPFESWEKIKRVTAVFAGHVFYLSIGTLGLIWIGLDVIFQKIKGKNQILIDYSEVDYRTFFIFLILTFAGTLALSGLFMEGAARLDHWMYGRYVEGVIAPILLIGLLSKNYRKAVLSMIIAFIATLILYGWMGEYSNTAPFNISTFWQEFYVRENGVWIWFLTGSVFLIFITMSNRIVAQFMIGVFFIFCIYHQINYHIVNSKQAIKRSDVAKYIRDNYKKSSCVGFDHSGITSYNRHIFWYDLSFALYDYRLQRLSFDDWLESCDGPLFSYSKDLYKKADVHPAAIAGFGGPVLWEKGRMDNSSLYPLVIKNHPANMILLLGEGWHGIESNHVWSTQKSILNLPIPQKCYENECYAKISFSVFSASKAKPLNVSFITENNILQTLTLSDGSQHDVSIPLTAKKLMQEVTISVPNASSPKEVLGSRDTRVLGIALRSIELVIKQK